MQPFLPRAQSQKQHQNQSLQIGGGGETPETGGDKEGRDTVKTVPEGEKPPPPSGLAAAGTGDTIPSIQVVKATVDTGGAIAVSLYPPTDWGTRDDGKTAVTKDDVKLWLYYLKDTAGTKTKEDIIKAVGTNAVTVGRFTIPEPLDTSGVIQLRGASPYNLSGGVFVQYACFVRIIHPDSTIANKAMPNANEGTEYSRDTAVVRGTSGGP